MNESKKKLEEYVDEHLARRRFASQTKASYAYWIYRLTDYFGVYIIDDILYEDVKEFIKSLEEKDGLSPSTVKQAVNALHFLFNSLARKEWEIKSLQTKSVKRKDHHIPSQEDVLTIINTITTEKSKLAISLIYGLGLNLDECVNIRKVDVDIEKGLIHIVSKNNKKSRKAIIPETVKPNLYNYLNKCTNRKWLFENYKGEKISHSPIQKALKRATKALDYSHNISIKTLRYAYIKHLEKLGLSLYDILSELGMSHSTSFQFYSKLGDTRKKVTFSPLDRRIPSNIKTELKPYVSQSRINELIDLQAKRFDLTRLIQLLTEVNIAYNNRMYLSVAMQVRAIIDHVPPIFDCSNFQEVANQYKGSKSFKKSMKNLQNSLRNIADAYLHTQIRRSETLPTAIQIDFKADLDVLLSEISRIKKK